MSLELPRMGHEVTVCPDGLTAVAALERNTYDCILVDLDMPGMNGIEVIARAKELSPDTEAVVLTGKSSLETAVAALRHGAFDYLTKPCKLVELEALLARVAEKRELTNKYRALKRQLERLEGEPRPDRHVATDAARPRADRQGRPDQLDRADPRRNRHRQGTGRPGRSRAEPASRHAVRGHQLRRAAGNADRERAVRPSQGRLHRRRRAPRRAVRSRRRRHAVPRRNRRTAQGDAGQAAAGAGKRRDPPRRRQRVVAAATSAWSAPRTAT